MNESDSSKRVQSSEDATTDEESGSSSIDVDDLSLEMLGRFYAEAVSGQRQAESTKEEGSGKETPSPGEGESEQVGPEDLNSLDDAVTISPPAILEAMLFVGFEDGRGLTARKAASMIRGVSPKEVDQLVEQLNEQYRQDQSAFEIDNDSDGYHLRLRPSMEPVRGRMYGQIRAARLSHAAIEVLSVVAYHQPVTAEDVDKLRLRGSGAILNQLVRRELLSVHRDEQNKRIRFFRTTEKFLQLFGLESIEDLPQAHLDNELEFLDQ